MEACFCHTRENITYYFAIVSKYHTIGTFYLGMNIKQLQCIALVSNNQTTTNPIRAEPTNQPIKLQVD